MDRLEFTVLPGGDDKTLRGVIGLHWIMRERYVRALAEAEKKQAALLRTVGKLSKDCQTQPRDIEAARQLLRRMIQLVNVDTTVMRRRCDMIVADTEYRNNMLEFADVPERYREDVVVDIIDTAGSVYIHFGPPSFEGRERSGFWILYGNGALHQVHTPTDL